MSNSVSYHIPPPDSPPDRSYGKLRGALLKVLRSMQGLSGMGPYFGTRYRPVYPPGVSRSPRSRVEFSAGGLCLRFHGCVDLVEDLVRPMIRLTRCFVGVL